MMSETQKISRIGVVFETCETCEHRRFKIKLPTIILTFIPKHLTLFCCGNGVNTRSNRHLLKKKQVGPHFTGTIFNAMLFWRFQVSVNLRTTSNIACRRGITGDKLLLGSVCIHLVIRILMLIKYDTAGIITHVSFHENFF